MKQARLQMKAIDIQFSLIKLGETPCYDALLAELALHWLLIVTLMRVGYILTQRERHCTHANRCICLVTKRWGELGGRLCWLGENEALTV